MSSAIFRHIQPREKTNVFQVNQYDGTAEIWFDSVEGLEAVLTSTTYQQKVFPDEKTFLDHKNPLITLGIQVGVVGTRHEGKESRGRKPSNRSPY